jgi:hypothetical protein
LTNVRIDVALDQMAGRPWPERLSTLGVFFANGLGIGAWAAAIPPLKAELSLSNGALSLVLLSFAAGAMAAMPLMGFMAARIPSGRATCAAGVSFAVALASPAFASSLPVACVLVFIIGAANGAMDVAMNAHATDVERRWGSPIMSSFHAGFSLGGAAGAILGGWLAASATALGLLGPCMLGLAILALAAGPLWNASGGLRTQAFALPGRRVIPLAAVALLYMMTEGAVGDWSGAYLAQSGVPIALAAAAYAAFSFCMIIGRVFGDGIVRFAGPRATVAFGGLIAAAGLAVSVAAPGLVASVIDFALVGAGLSNAVPVIFSAAGRAGSSPSAGIAAAATAGYAGLLVGPVVVGGVAAIVDLRTAIGALVAVALLAAGLAFSGTGGLR